MRDSTHPSAREASPRRRTLVVVLHADMVGYSRLIALDDAGTLHRLGALRQAVVDPEVQRYSGKLVQSAGDSMLISFDSIDRAVECAIAIQERIPESDGAHAADRRIRFRIGVNIGDVIADEHGLHGDGINVAARLQQACPAGGVCVSRSVHDHLQSSLRQRFERLGTLALKNIAQPIEAFALGGRDAGPAEALPVAGLDRPSASLQQVRTFERSNDFLAAGDENRLPALVGRSRFEVWLVGATFYITVGQYRALILKRLAEGVSFNVLALRPGGRAIETMATLLGVTAEELTLDCMSGIRVLQRTQADAARAGCSGQLHVRLLDQPFQTRFYFFDPRSRSGRTFFVPQIGGINSQTMPGFLVGNAEAPWVAHYFDAIEAIWNGPDALPLTHSDSLAAPGG